jgi:hypothetical protein
VAQKLPPLRTFSVSSSVRRRPRRGLHGLTCCRYVRRGQTGTCRIVALTYDMRYKANRLQVFYKLRAKTVGRHCVNTSHVKRKKHMPANKGSDAARQTTFRWPIGWRWWSRGWLIRKCPLECRLAGVGGVIQPSKYSCIETKRTIGAISTPISAHLSAHP